MKTFIAFILISIAIPDLFVYAIPPQSAQTVQCKAITKAGNRCKRMTRSSNGLCSSHGGTSISNSIDSSSQNTQKDNNVTSNSIDTSIPRPTNPETPSNSIAKPSQTVQCSATTKAGNRCKRMTRSPNGQCSSHGGN